MIPVLAKFTVRWALQGSFLKLKRDTDNCLLNAGLL